MNTSSSKKHRSADYGESKGRNAEAEVFVLPPNLLEKLGIKLDSIVPTDETPPMGVKTSDFVDKSLLSNQNVEKFIEGTFNSKNESSILETASLMKESVFLSPTFVPTVANVIPGEMEIARPYELSLQINDNGKNELENSESFVALIDPKQNIFCNFETVMENKKNRLNNCHTNDNMPCVPIETNCVPSEILENTVSCPVLTKNGQDNVNGDIDKSESSSLEMCQKKNVNTEVCTVPRSFKIDKKQLNTATKNKINVINEQVLDVSKLYKCKSINPNLNNNILTPVSVGMVLPIVNKKHDTISSNKLCKINDVQDLITLSHASDKAQKETDVSHSEKICFMVEKDDFQHVNVNDDYTLVCSNTNLKKNNTNEITEMDIKNSLEHDVIKVNKKVYQNVKNSKQGNNYIKLFDGITLNGDNNLKEGDPHVFRVTAKDMNSMNNAEILDDNNCEATNLGKSINGNSERYGHFDLYFHASDKLFNNSKSTMHNRSINSSAPSEYASVNAKDAKMSRCMTDKNELSVNSENLCVTGHESSEKIKDMSRVLSLKNIEKESNKSKTGLRKSKLSIQGVEKPGGDFEDIKKNVKAEVNERLNIPQHKTYIKDQKQLMNELPESSLSGEKNKEMKKNKVLKTYKRDKKQTKICNSNFNVHVKPVDDLYEAIEIETPNINLDVVCKADEFCLCGDFGQLKYYDYDTSYEHIHFWKHKDVTSDHDLIFSIYKVETMHNYNDEAISVELINESPEELMNKICWNEIKGVDNDKHANDVYKNYNDHENKEIVQAFPVSVSSETGLSKNNLETSKINLPCDILKVVNTPDIDSCRTTGNDVEKNIVVSEYNNSLDNACLKSTKMETCLDLTETKRKETTSLNIEDIKIYKEVEKKKLKRKSSAGVVSGECSKNVDEPRSKKDIKCGVCGLILLVTEWEEHSSKEHGLIAWKAGQSFDFRDERLLMSMKQKLKEDGVLKCRFCNIEISRCKPYLLHVQECIKTNVSCTSLEKPPSKSVMKNCKKDKDSSNKVNCGVCKHDVKRSDWLVHICQKHNYLAWISGETPLNLNDTDSIEKHLRDVIKDHGPIICSQCGFDRKYRLKSVKTYIEHIRTCKKLGNISIKEEDSVDKNVIDSEIEQDSSICTEPLHTVKCGVCEQVVDANTWVDHIGKEHNYLAWKEGEKSLDLEDQEQVWQHLYEITKKQDGLICSKCGIKRKYVKKFLSHIKECDGTTSNNESLLSSPLHVNRRSSVHKSYQPADSTKRAIKCGVCLEQVRSRDWIKHIQTEHKYMAWKDGETPVDESSFEGHLCSIMREHGCLQCPKCGLEHQSNVSSVKFYLTHVSQCQPNKESKEKPLTSSEAIDVKCGVCEKVVNSTLWIEHIECEHNYMAWKDGDPPLDLNDDECIRLYLFTLINKVGAFKCVKCGTYKKYPKSFITHLKSCSVADGVRDENVSLKDEGTCECAVCSEKVPIKKWKDHAMNKHYNIAWKVGGCPIDLKSTYGTDKCLKEYKQKKGNLICKLCGASRASAAGFYAHILACGKTEEELEEYKNVCEVCNNKYLCIYKNQHMAWHREQEYAKERKLKAHETTDTEVPEAPAGRRKAALIANDVIEKLSSTNNFKHTCAACGFDTDCEKKLGRHKCSGAVENFEENNSSNGSDESEYSKDFDMYEDDDIRDSSKKKKNKESMVQGKVPNVPFKYNELNSNSYITQSNEDFYKVHFTDEMLFPQWNSSEYEFLPDQQLIEYMPSMEKSCQVKINNEWNVFDRFQARKSTNGYSIFVGASVQCLSWIPPRMDDGGVNNNYLAVSCHRGTDCPRYNCDELGAHPGLIQIWDFGLFVKKTPEFVMGLAHDYGTIWAMDWCPSGTRDLIQNVEQSKWARAGLLAVACSNGFVYILSVPYPSTIGKSGAYLKLKAVAELRLSNGTNRRLYQATAVTWSKEKGHVFVAVGYADGTTAFYDLNNSSPLLRCTENGITVFYPYHDEREHNVCVTDMDTIVGGSEGCGTGAVCSASLGGTAAVVRAGAPLARLVSHAAATGCRFAPGWPSVMLAIDDAIASQAPNEMDWYGCGRRLGPVCACTGCLRCGRVLLYAPPLLRTLRALPPYAELRKQNLVGVRAVPLKKQRVKPNDELSMRVEPLTYDEVITQFGIEIFFVDANEKNNSINTVKEQWTERFPLSDVSSMAFCPSEKYHEKVAVGMHAGLVLLFTV